MGLLDLLGRRPPEPAVARAVADAVAALPGVEGHDLAYNHQRNGSGAVTGRVDVPDSATFLEVLRAVRRGLDGPLGRRADLVVIDLTARTPDGVPLAPGELGLSSPPSGREVRERLL
ncbi:hypothetical protein GCM10023340_01830 [Nocardioides marinquilinus]|uniref:Uncharacterized protein n=1 Tax=Nocardioides marinquilinus TaxID=1210400 RepID=A0ABP9P509_9ACTN